MAEPESLALLRPLVGSQEGLGEKQQANGAGQCCSGTLHSCAARARAPGAALLFEWPSEVQGFLCHLANSRGSPSDQ